MITYFWEWITRSIGAVLNWFNTVLTNSDMAPFFDLFIVIFLIACLIKFIVMPLTGLKTGSSDKARKKEE